MLTLDEVRGTIDSDVNGCGDHKAAPFSGADVASIVRARRYCSCGLPDDRRCDSYCDSGSVGVVLLKDGRFGVWWEDSDTSGHG